MFKHYQIIFYLLQYLIMLMLLTSCCIHIDSSFYKNQLQDTWYQHYRIISNLNHYKIYGSCVYISKKTNKNMYTYFNFQQFNINHYQLSLINLFGITEIILDVHPNFTKLLDKQGKCYIGSNPETIFNKIFGIILPVNNFHQWIIGLPGNVDNFILNSKGYIYKLNFFNQKKHWIITYISYFNYKSLFLPKIIEIYNNNDFLKLKINNWIL